MISTLRRKSIFLLNVVLGVADAKLPITTITMFNKGGICRRMINRDKNHKLDKHYTYRMQRQGDFVCHQRDKLANRYKCDFQVIYQN